MQYLHSFWMLLASLTFAIMAATIKLSAQEGASLGLIILFRGVPSVLFILLWAIAAKQSLKPISYKLHIMRNVFGCSAMWLSFYCFSVLPLSISTSLNYTAPLFVGSWVILSSKNKNKDILRLLGIATGFLGILIILRPSVVGEQILAITLGLFSGVFASIAMIQIRSLGLIGEPVWRTVFYFSIIVSITGLFSVSLFGYGQLAGHTWFSLSGVGIAGLIGQLAMTKAYGAGSPVLTAAFQYSTIIFATLIGVFVWHELPDFFTWLGMLIVIGAGVFSAWRTVIAFNRKSIKDS